MKQKKRILKSVKVTEIGIIQSLILNKLCSVSKDIGETKIIYKRIK